MEILVALNHKLNTEQERELISMGYTTHTYLENNNKPLFQRVANCPGNRTELEKLADEFAQFVSHSGFMGIVLPIGSPAFLFLLSRKLKNISVLFAHTERCVQERVEEDGSVTKTSVFKHVRFIKVDV